MSPIDQITLRNRLLVATAMWKETIAEPLPRMPPGDPADQITSFEITLVDRLWQSATADPAREIADRTWDLRRRPGKTTYSWCEGNPTRSCPSSPRH